MSKRSLVERWFAEVFTQGKVDTVKEITTEDFASHVPGHDFKGPDEFNDFLKWFRQVFVEGEWTINDFLEVSDKATVRYTGYTTYKDGWLDIPSTDQRVKETGIMIIRFEGDRIQEMWSEMSDLDLMHQLRPFD